MPWGWPGAPYLAGGPAGYSPPWPACGMGFGFHGPAPVPMPVRPLGYGGGQALPGVGSGRGYGGWSGSGSLAGGVAGPGPSALGPGYQAARQRMRQSVKGRADLDGQRVWAAFEVFMGGGGGDLVVATPDDVAR